ncbi:hypothetical protein OG389_11490 [Streptomyces sp. NBC_00435]|uniref:hypothetical protein n=1 Tax=Streptomyces sp. NBC_00435 TaxID=2903649 RepID=UPI002E1D6BD6
MRAGEVLDALFELVRRLDVGAMGEVREGIDRRIRRTVAIKPIREEADPAPVPEPVSRLDRRAGHPEGAVRAGGGVEAPHGEPWRGRGGEELPE